MQPDKRFPRNPPLTRQDRIELSANELHDALKELAAAFATTNRDCDSWLQYRKAKELLAKIEAA